MGTWTVGGSAITDARRTGIYAAGSYWGGGGEQIDTLSGNLNFSLPLVKAQGRTGWQVPVGLSYNSQNWRQDDGVNLLLGEDVGYGFGWQAQVGSITPHTAITQSSTGVDYYIYQDGTGAGCIEFGDPAHEHDSGGRERGGSEDVEFRSGGN